MITPSWGKRPSLVSDEGDTVGKYQTVRSGRNFPLHWRAATLVSAIACALGIGIPWHTASASASTPSASPVLPMTVDATGWIHYENLEITSLALKDRKVATVSGRRDKDGSCVFGENARLTLGGPAGYSEEVAFNPNTCQAKVESGTLSQSAEGNQPNTNPNTGLIETSESTPVGTASTPSSASVAGPATTQSFADFEKVSYVDPLDITITSLTNNLHWESSNNRITEANATGVSYKFAWDNWSASNMTWTWWGYPSYPSYTEDQVAQTFYNTDFEAVIVAIMGYAGYAACGFDSSPATFYLAPQVKGTPSGYYYYGHLNSVSGGCSDLVHFRENHGSGSSS